jgi:hypothetical protein|tara:strand:- start:43 stop:549 length:507 start_codon:yes stop_codon:yes gene_type:complete
MKKPFKILIIIFFISLSTFGQNKWAETHSIVNPVKLNKIKIFELTSEKVINLFGKPTKTDIIWSEYDDENITYYTYGKSYFAFRPNKNLHDFEIKDRAINNISVIINNHSVGDSLEKLKKYYYKSTINMSNNEVRIHLVTSDFNLSSSIITFKITNESIESMELVNLN